MQSGTNVSDLLVLDGLTCDQTRLLYDQSGPKGTNRDQKGPSAMGMGEREGT